MYKILFNLEMEYHFNALYPLFYQFREDPAYQVYFRVGADPSKLFGLFKLSRQKEIMRRLETDNIQMTDKTSGFDLVVCGDALDKPERFGDILRIHVDHGVGIKTSRIRNIAAQENFHYHVFLEGQYWYDYIKSLSLENIADFYQLGIPKLDPLFWPQYYNNKKLVSELGISPQKKTVLFAPSYKPSCIDEIKAEIVHLAEAYNLIIKLHPYSWSGRYAPHSHHRYYEKLAARNSDIYLIPRNEYDIYPYLVLADTLISETSSVLNEFLALGKFGIIYVLSNYKEVHSDGMEVLSIDPKEWLLGAFPHLNSPDQLSEAVEKALNPTKEMTQKLNEYKNYMFTGLDGKSSQRVKAKIDQLLKEGA